jgi:prevent-host-death family protein
MPALKEVSSRDARKQWRWILDTVMTGDSDVAISRHGQEIAVIIPANDYYAIAEELEELRLARLAESIYEDYLSDRDSAKPYEEVRAELLTDE